MKTLLSALVLAFLITGCDQTAPTQQSENADMFSEESMLKFASAPDSDPGLVNPEAGMHNGPRHGRMMQHLIAYLSLTEDQLTAIRVLGDDMFSALSAIRDQVQADAISHEEAQALVHELRTQFMDDVRALLTPEQQSLLDSWEQNRWERGHRRGGGRHGG